MGVISLRGKAQAKEIEQRVLQRVGAEEMERRNIHCGDAYNFQGDERDVIFMSMVASRINEREDHVLGFVHLRLSAISADSMWPPVALEISSGCSTRLALKI